MELRKDDLKSDAVANLYRSAYYLAKGSNKLALEFFKKAKKKLEIKIKPPWNQLKEEKKRLFWAEKILDQYHAIKYS